MIFVTILRRFASSQPRRNALRLRRVVPSLLASAGIALSGMLLCVSAPVFAQGKATTSSFTHMKGLVGTWRQADKPDSPLRIQFSLTAGGTVLVEEWMRGSQSHSLTLYHQDGKSMIATHYCPQGNQPRLTLLPVSTAKILRFRFRDATDLDAAKEAHVRAIAFDMSHKGTVFRSETYRQAGKDETSQLRLVRDQ